MKDAFGALNWTPDTFWNATMTEFFRAVEGFNARQGGEEKPEAPTDDEVADLLAKYG